MIYERDQDGEPEMIEKRFSIGGCFFTPDHLSGRADEVLMEATLAEFERVIKTAAEKMGFISTKVEASEL